ncbi:MAG: carboxypeptidase-like regulatory domain-containing protein, partial [Planctomycetota bacterium]
MWCTPEWADLGERLIAPDTFEQWIIDRDARVRVDWGYGETIVEVSGGLVSRCRVGGKPTRVIRGSVRTAEGQPLAGMTVWTYEHRGLLPDVQTSTDANGRWSLGLGSQAAVITCNGPGYTCVREFRLPEGDATPEVDLVARPLTGSLTGVCVDLSGRPVAQALVYADGGALDQDAMPHALAVSQKDGTFELAVPPTGWPRHCELITSKHGWALWTRDLHSIDAGQPLTIVMGPSQKVQGRLLREDGSPFPGATVFVEGLSSSTLAENRRDWTTDASGGWVMDRIDGVVELRAMDSEYRHLCGRVVQGADWDAEEIVLWARPRADAWWVSVRAGSLAETGDCIVAHQHGGDVQHCTSPRTFWVTGEANQPTELSLMRGDQVLARQNVLGDVSKRLT